jgi:large subunit ribosomal protein L25
MKVTIKCEKRENFGKNASRRIRKEGNLPAILYGPNTDNVSLILNKKDFFNILKSESGENTIFKVEFDSDKRDVMIKALQQDVVSDEILHVDLIQIALDKVIRVMVPLVLTGEAAGVKAEGGFVDFVTREVEAECLPKDIPEYIEVDITELHLNQSAKMEVLTEIEGVQFTSDPQMIIALIKAPSAVEEIEEEVEEVEEEIISEEEEPEVIKKEKTEEKE